MCGMAITEQTFSVSVSTLLGHLVNRDTYPQWLVGTRHTREVSDDVHRPPRWKRNSE